MGKKHAIDDEDKDLFRSTVRNIRPLTHTKITPEQKLIRPRKIKQPHEANPNPLNLHESDYVDEVSGEDRLEFHRGGLQHKVLRNFRQGKYNVEAILDMHGMRVTEAREALNEFLLTSKQRNIRSILIIHGKGHGTNKPVLKNKINQWLRQVDFVLAFSSATSHAGSSGALYVLLKGK